MPRPIWPPEYVNGSVNVLLDSGIPDGAYRLYQKLRALSWGEDTLSINFVRLLELTELTRTRVYEYARILRFHRGLLSYAVRGNAFECSFIPAGSNPEIRDNPSLLVLDKKTPTNQEQKTKAPASRNPGKRDTPNLFPLAQALADVCRMPLEANRGRLFSEAKLLAKVAPPPTPELLKEYYNGRADCWWRSEDWRGQKGQDPTPPAIRETWGKWKPVVVVSKSGELTPEQIEMREKLRAFKANQNANPV